MIFSETDTPRDALHLIPSPVDLGKTSSVQVEHVSHTERIGEAPAGAKTSHPRVAPWAILGLALVARLLVLWIAITKYPHGWLYSRGMEMGFLANSLVHGQGYSSPFGGSTGPTAFIAPGYPTLVAAIFALFGTYSFASAIVIMSLQIAVNLCTIYLILWIARTIFGEGTANLAGIFWALSLPLLWIPTIFWETSLSACAVVGMIAFALRYSRQPTTRAALGLGIAAGIASLINPALLPTLLAMLGWGAWQTRKTGPWRQVLMIAAMVLAYAAWPIRNAYRFHAFIPTRTTVGFELYMGNRPGATGYLDESILPIFNQQEMSNFVSEGEIAYVGEKSTIAKKYILENPGIFVEMSARRFFRFWTGTGNTRGSQFYVIHAVLTTTLGFAGLAMLFVRRQWALGILISLPILIFPLPYYITHAEFRYRLNIDPVMTVLAAYAFVQLVARFSGRSGEGQRRGLEQTA